MSMVWDRCQKKYVPQHAPSEAIYDKISMQAISLPQSSSAHGNQGYSRSNKENDVLRALMLYLSRAQWANRIVTRWGLARRAASRFVAGDTFEQALGSIRELNARGLLVTIDHLGENVTTEQEASQATENYLQLVSQLVASEAQANISLKLTQLGIKLDLEQCQENLRRISARAAESGMMVRIDMEDTPVIEQTLQIWRALRAGGQSNLGLVFQTYLYRTEADLNAALLEGARVRLVKGAYDEPAHLAYPRKADVDREFDRLAVKLIDHALHFGVENGSSNGHVPPITALATHDERRIGLAIEHAERVGLPKKSLEFQMLYGIRADLQQDLAARGYPVRVYVPYGTEWFSYFMRRLAERPANLWFLISNLFKR